MKKFLKILFIVLLVLFIVVLTLPFVFKGEIMKLAKQEINNTVKAEVEWTDFRISLFKGFPDLKVTMDNMSVIGIEEFEGDTLLAFDAFSVKVDLISAFSGNVKVKSVILDKPVMRAIAIDSVTVNWDIMYPSQDVQEEEEVEDTSEMDLNVELREFIIRDASIRYSDLEGDMFAGIENFNFLLSGNFAMDYTDLDVETWSDEITVEIGGVKYLNKAFFGFEGLLGADLINYKFTLNENELKLNEIVLGLEGFFNITNESAYEVDVDFSTKETQFKSLLSMVPAMYMADFEGLETSGSLSLNGSAKGMISDEEYPKVNMNLLVKDGFFAYPDLPKNASDIQIDLKVFYDGVFADNSKIDLDKFHVKLGGNPVDMNFHVITPESDMQMSGAVNGNIDLATLADVIPMEDAQLDGAVKMNIEMMGRMSDIENENYEAFRADGLLEITNVVAEGADIPIPVEIEKTTMLFSPQYVDLQTFEATIGSSDIQMSGKLENFIPYVFKDETIRGELVLNSSLLNLNELMIESTDEPEDVIEDTLELSVVEIPQNIDFTFNSKLDKVIYDQLEVENVIGRIYTREGKVVMDMLSMDLLDGSMILNGEYNTQDITTPMIDMGMKMTNIDIGKSFEAFNTIQKLAPVAKMCRGNVSVDFDFSSFLDSTMSPVMNSIVGSGRLQTNEVKIENNETFEKIGNLLKSDKLTNSKFRDVDLNFDVRNGRVFVEPFDTKLGNADVTIAGDQGIDQTMNYTMNFSIPRSEFGNSANDLLEDFAAQAQSKGFDLNPGDDVNVQLKIKGSFSDPEISMDLKENMANLKTEMKQAVQQKVEQEVEKVKEDVRENVSEEIDKIMADAEKEADNIRKKADEAADALVGEAELRKKQLIDEAGNNPLKKIVAEKTGDELVKKAEQQAQKLRDEADKKANNLLEKAKERAESLKNR